MRPSLRLLPLALAAALAQAHAQPASAPDALLCRGPEAIPAFRELTAPASARADSPTRIEADDFDVSEAQRTILTGGVELWRADQWLGTEHLVYEHATQSYRASGAVRYQDEGMRFTAERMQGDLDADRHALEGLQYQIVTERGNGVAALAQFEGPRGRLEQATYSTCEPDRRSWEFRAGHIEIDQEEGVGVARNATLYVGRVPVLYTPGASFPIDDRRRSGFLYPTIGQTQDSGLDVIIPYYLNLAPNYDATLSARILGRRGVMLGGEFRYLTPAHQGVIEGAWMPEDRAAERSRDELRINHVTRLGGHWNAVADIWRVSDPRYLEDFGGSSYYTSISQIRSSVGLFGRGTFWDAQLSASEFQLTDPLLTEDILEYSQRPRAQFRYARPLLDWLVIGLRSEAVAFEHPTPNRVDGNRVDLMPYVSMPFEGDAWFVTPQLSYRYTAYDIDRSDDATPSRALPIASLDLGAFFERPTRLLGRDFLQTLEPRLFYLYAPYRDQSNLPIFDTGELTFGYPQLFRENRFSGADRQADADQVTVAVTNRLLDPATGREWMNASLGQIRYFRQPRVGMPGQPLVEASGSDYVGEVEILYDDRWSFRTTQIYSPALSSTTLSAYRGQYRWANGALANLGYRYRRDVLEQADISALYPISPNWRLVGRWNYSMRDRSTVDAVAGFEWEGCCVAVRLLGRHYVRNREGEKNNAIYLEIELKGLGSFGRRTDELLERAILDYQR